VIWELLPIRKTFYKLACEVGKSLAVIKLCVEFCSKK
jgi:hypothetical protein